jgi:tetratricopeptide (TPR) repeat protein
VRLPHRRPYKADALYRAQGRSNGARLPPSHGYSLSKKSATKRALSFRRSGSLKASIALDPNSAFGYFLLADDLDFAEKPEDAIESLNKAIRLDPRNRLSVKSPNRS